MSDSKGTERRFPEDRLCGGRSWGVEKGGCSRDEEEKEEKRRRNENIGWPKEVQMVV